MQEDNDRVWIEKSCAEDPKSKLIHAPWSKEEGMIVGMELSPDESMLAVASLRAAAVFPKPVDPKGYAGACGVMVVTIFSMPQGQQLRLVRSCTIAFPSLHPCYLSHHEITVY